MLSSLEDVLSRIPFGVLLNLKDCFLGDKIVCLINLQVQPLPCLSDRIYSGIPKAVDSERSPFEKSMPTSRTPKGWGWGWGRRLRAADVQLPFSPPTEPQVWKPDHQHWAPGNTSSFQPHLYTLLPPVCFLPSPSKHVFSQRAKRGAGGS